LGLAFRQALFFGDATMTMTANFQRRGYKIVQVAGKKAPSYLASLRIPPAWKDVQVERNPRAACLATGVDEAGRLQRLYSDRHKAAASAGKFKRVRELLAAWDAVRAQIEKDLNRKAPSDAALVAYLIFETGLRPGSTADTRAKVQAFGATTLQLRHIKPAAGGVRLQFVGKKGVYQNVLVTNPYLARVLLKRKRATSAYTTPVFDVSAAGLRRYFATLGDGSYSPKDFRTANGTRLARELLDGRQRLPTAKGKRKQLVNAALDAVAKLLGNTRAVCRSAYVDPVVLARFEN